MRRRLALSIAGSAALVVLAGGAALAANLGILGSTGDEPVGQLDASTVADLSTPVTSVEPVVVTVDEIVPVPVPVESGPGAEGSGSRGEGTGPDAERSGTSHGADDSPSGAVSGSGGPAVTTSTIARVDDSGSGDDDRRGRSSDDDEHHERTDDDRRGRDDDD